MCMTDMTESFYGYVDGFFKKYVGKSEENIKEILSVDKDNAIKVGLF